MRESEKNNKDEAVSKKRAPWQRPALRRLDASLAQSANACHDDGGGNNEHSGSECGHHS